MVTAYLVTVLFWFVVGSYARQYDEAASVSRSKASRMHL